MGGLCASCLLFLLFFFSFGFLITRPGVVGLVATGVAGLLAASAAAARAAAMASSFAFAAASLSALRFLAAAVDEAKVRLPGSPCRGFSSVKGSSA